MERYHQVSQQIHAIFDRFTPLVEPLSLDEAFLDVSGCQTLFGPPTAIAARIKELIRLETGLTCSAGVASSKLVAKIASDLDKPDGLTVVPPGTEKQFLSGLAIERLWGVGKNTCRTLGLMGVKTIGDLQRLPESLLDAKFGKHGLQMRQAAMGLDQRRVEPERAAQSVGNEETFADDLVDPARIRQELLGLAVRVGRRLRRHALRGRTVTVKIKYHDFVQITRSVTLAETTDDDRTIYQTACGLLTKSEAGRRPLRLLGISVANLTPADAPGQQSLFPLASTSRPRKLNQALDNIADKYGSRTVVPATLLPPGGAPRRKTRTEEEEKTPLEAGSRMK